MKKLCILLMCLSLSFVSFSVTNDNSLSGRTEGWLQRDGSNGPLRGTGIQGEEATPAPTVPVGDALPYLIFLSGAYILYVSLRRRKEAID